MFWNNDFFDKDGKMIKLGDFICIDAHSFEVYSTVQSGLCIKDFDKCMKSEYLKNVDRLSNTRTIYSLDDLNLSNIFICDREAYPECFV